MAANLRKLIGDWLEYMAVEKQCSPSTTENYQRYLARFSEYAGDIDVNEITYETISKYRRYLADSSRLGQASQNYHVIALKSFLRYLSICNIKTMNYYQVEVGKTVHAQREALDRTEVLRLLSMPKLNNLIGLRDSAMLELFVATGMRVGELSGVTKDKLNFNTMQFTIRGKGQKDRLVFLTPRCVEAISRYLEARYDNSPFLFVELSTAKAEQLSIRHIQRIVKQYATLAGITKKVSPHTLRHSFATNLRNNGADMREVQEMLGHASITTTQQYVHITSPQLKEAHSRYSQL